MSKQHSNNNNGSWFPPVLETYTEMDVVPRDYTTRFNIALQGSIPIWDISFAQLQVLVHSIRLKPYYDWEYRDAKCVKKEIKRRIPWLYPVDGKFQITSVTYYDTF